MKPSESLEIHREGIRRIVERNGARNPRIFGSVLHNNDTEGSDIDILVDAIQGVTTLISLVHIQREIEKLTGFKVDVTTPGSLRESIRDRILGEAKPI